MPRPRCSATTATMALLSTARPRLPSSGPPTIGFVGLDLAGKAVAAGPRHGPPQLVQPGPGGLVAAEAEGTLQPQGAHPVLLAGNEPHRQEPCPQRLAGPFEYRAGGYRGLPAACPAPQPATGHFPRLADNPTVWAAKPVGQRSRRTYRHGKQPHPETTRPVPGRCLGSQRPPPDALRPSSIYNISRSWGNQGDTHYELNSAYGAMQRGTSASPAPPTPPAAAGHRPSITH